MEVSRSTVAGKLRRLGMQRGVRASAEEYAERRRARDRAKKAKQREKQRGFLTSFRPGTSKTAPIYRRSMPVVAEMTSKRELRAFLAQAVRNTAEVAA